uniref:Macrophage expressed protein-like isoform 1 n=1 Tax=Littorina littorea TaxID=31216 RepID=A0A165X514_LITLI|nr:macrophage expressed protein-like isoform 1 [Littorina littorea]
MTRASVLLLALTLTFATVRSSAVRYVAENNNNNDDSIPYAGQAPPLYPRGDPRRCLEVGRQNGYEMMRFEVLPGFGWDNLRNVYEGQVVTFNYSQCRTTDDGRFLLPDSVSAVPIKASHVHTFAELITHWKNWTSSTARSINVDAGLSLTNFGISGKFSSDFEDVKSKQIGDKSLTTRAQLRYIRYQVQLQPDTPLHPVFKSRVLSIAAANELGEREQARFLAQLLVRDFGTHVVTKADAGAALEQVDQIREDWVLSQQEKKSDILASASASLFKVFKMSASYETKTDDKFVDAYQKQRTSSSILTKGGPLFRPANFTPDMWALAVDQDLVALDRSGDPIYYVITGSQLPELPASTLNEVYTNVKEAVETYYSYNRIPGCLDPISPNFSPSANTEDGSCKPPPTNLTFGGVFQTCAMQPGSDNGNLCADLPQVNPLTGGFSCPAQYQAVKLHSGSMTSSRTDHVCHRHLLFWKKCHDEYHHSLATYNFYWCVASGPVPPNSGYLFGGLYSSKVENPVTRGPTCPPTFFPLKVGDKADLHVCISDDYEFGEEFSVPFAGFISCDAGNPLAVSDPSASQGPKKLQGHGQKKSLPPGSKPHGNLKQFFHDKASEWPQRCPDGYSRHLATVDQGCQINYCVMTGAMAGPVLPPIKRPPFVSDPPVPPPDPNNMVIFDPATKTWKRNGAAQAMLLEPAAQSSGENSDSSSEASSSLSAGAAAGISIGATLACVAIATIAVLAVRSRRQKGRAGYRRLQNPLLEPQEDYGSVRESGRTASTVTVEVAGENGQ